ncbi:hypothetical protein pdam_00002930 [Pocillopora damicornis]|uniref:Uncharacterized protein n=1 Tax=Pocillopora damicornis TaxID=46731 RepID=A0A3M6U8S9_POCDA|nr:hypothetical protein pdam_00002930 [Pocillopora damicornis]
MDSSLHNHNLYSTSILDPSDSWRVFKTEFMGAVPYSDELFYPILFGCAITVILFPLIGPLHQSAFNVYYRFRVCYYDEGDNNTGKEG